MSRALKDRKIRVFAPGTVANVGCGFDIFGFALEAPGDELFLQISENSGVTISKITGDDGNLPHESRKNTAGLSLLAMLSYLKADFGVQIELHKQMPVGSGLGSSAASAVAAVFALNSLLSKPLSKDILLRFAMEGERITSGSEVHLDNIAACMYGGFILVRSKDPIDIVSIPIPEDLFCTVIHPKIEIKTHESRMMLKKDIPLSTAITQWGNVAGMTAALLKKDYALLSRSLKDVIAEPIRSILIPYFKDMNELAINNGALGFSISGSGPSVFTLSNNIQIARKIGGLLKDLLHSHEIENDVYLSKINNIGPKILH
jgi:homoserine kinase